MGKNLFSKLAVTNKPHKGSFDLSYRNICSCEFGQLIPFDVREVVPSDHFKINSSTFTRTKPLVSAAYTRFREHIDYYFVPYRLLWRFSDSLMTGTPVNNSAVSSSLGNTSLNTDSAPYITASDIKSSLDFIDQIQGTQANPYYLFDDGGLRCSTTSPLLLNLLGYGDWINYKTSPDIVNTPNMSVYRLLAYQKIYQDFYRNDQWEELCPQAFNVDYLLPSAPYVPLKNMVNPTNHKAFSYASFLAMKYANYPKDIFTGVLPKSQFGATAYVDAQGTIDFTKGASGSLLIRTSSVSDTESYPLYVGTHESSSGDSVDVGFKKSDLSSVHSTSANLHINGGTLQLKDTSRFSVLDLRYAQALQKYREITESHKLNYKSQINAHFGINVSDDRSDMCKYLGGRVSTFSLNEVTNTNLTGDNTANLAANGVASTSCDFDFTAREHGIIMGIYYVEPLLDYYTHPSLFNFKLNKDDFFKPEFDNLGMQSANIFGISDHEFALKYFKANKSTTCGYLPRYFEYKLPQDTIDSSASIAFPQWVAPVKFNDLFKGIYNTDTTSVSYRSFKIKPALLNNLFSVQISDTSKVVSFRLLTCFTNNCVGIRPMSESGLPY